MLMYYVAQENDEAEKAAAAELKGRACEVDVLKKERDDAVAESKRLELELESMAGQVEALEGRLESSREVAGGWKEKELEASLASLEQKYKALEEEHNDLLILLAENNDDEEDDDAGGDA